MKKCDCCEVELTAESEAAITISDWPDHNVNIPLCQDCYKPVTLVAVKAAQFEIDARRAMYGLPRRKE